MIVAGGTQEKLVKTIHFYHEKVHQSSNRAHTSFSLINSEATFLAIYFFFFYDLMSFKRDIKIHLALKSDIPVLLIPAIMKEHHEAGSYSFLIWYTYSNI